MKRKNKSNIKSITIIIPVYNEEKFIQATIKKVIKSDTLSLKKEIIIVDDGSLDNTVKIIKQYIQEIGKQKNRHIELIEKKKNQGKGSALKLGFLKSKGDIVLVQDADLEYSPDEYPALIKPFIENNADCVYGSRFISSKPHRILYFWNYAMNKMLTTLSNILTNLNLTDMETGCKVFKGDIIRKIAKKIQSKSFGIEPEITAYLAKIKDIRIYEIGISYHGRTYNQGKKIKWTDGLKAIWEILKYNIFIK